MNPIVVDEATKAKNRKILIWMGLVGGTLMLCLGMAAAAPSTGKSGTATAETKSGSQDPYNAADASACMHFHNIMADINQGLLTDAELRVKIGEVRNDARTPAVQTAATHLYAAVTSGQGVTAAGAELLSACQLL